MPAPPVLVATYGPSSYSSSSPLTTSVTAEAGDLLVLIATTGNAPRVVSTPTGGSGIVWTLRQSVAGITGYANAYVWTAPVPSAQTLTASIAASGGSAGAQFVSFKVLRFAGSNGVGASAKANGSGTPSLNLTTLAADSALVVANVDWNAVSGASRAWNTSAGPVTEIYHYSGSAQTETYGVHPNTGPAGAKAIGLTAPAGQKWSTVAVEIRPLADLALGGPGTLTIAATVHVPGALTLDGAGPLDLAGVFGARDDVPSTGSGSLALSDPSWGYKGSPDPFPLIGSGALAFSSAAVTVTTSFELTGPASLILIAEFIEVPSGGSLAVDLTGPAALGLTGGAGFSDDVTFTGSGQLVWTPVAVEGTGALHLGGIGSLKLDDPNAKPIYAWTGETWRPVGVAVWNGRAWLPLRADDIHIP